MESRSHVVVVNPGKMPRVVESHWQPGYSKGHKETPKEAILVALDSLAEELKAKNLLRRQLQALLAGVEEKDIEQYLKGQEEDLKQDLKDSNIAVYGEYLVVCTGQCTCSGGGVEVGYAHENGCGYEPIGQLLDIVL